MEVCHEVLGKGPPPAVEATLVYPVPFLLPSVAEEGSCQVPQQGLDLAFRSLAKGIVCTAQSMARPVFAGMNKREHRIVGQDCLKGWVN